MIFFLYRPSADYFFWLISNTWPTIKIVNRWKTFWNARYQLQRVDFSNFITRELSSHMNLFVSKRTHTLIQLSPRLMCWSETLLLNYVYTNEVLALIAEAIAVSVCVCGKTKRKHTQIMTNYGHFLRLNIYVSALLHRNFKRSLWWFVYASQSMMIIT